MTLIYIITCAEYMSLITITTGHRILPQIPVGQNHKKRNEIGTNSYAPNHFIFHWQEHSQFEALSSLSFCSSDELFPALPLKPVNL